MFLLLEHAFQRAENELDTHWTSVFISSLVPRPLPPTLWGGVAWGRG